MTLAIIAGSAATRLPGFQTHRREKIDTPYGTPSADITFGRFNDAEVIFLPRHGDAGAIAPHRINYRANLFALKQVGAARIVALASVGGIASHCRPGALLIPHQLIDYTHDRAHTFFDRDDNDPAAMHIDFTEPYHEALRAEILAAAAAAGVAVGDRAVYAATQGPRLETAAEIDRLERDGADIVGMTGMPEAALARELGMQYACIAMVVNAAAGRGAAITMRDIAVQAEGCLKDAVKVLRLLIEGFLTPP